MKKSISFISAILIILLSLASCADKSVQNNADQNESNVTSESETSEITKQMPDLPSDIDMNGEAVVFLTRGEQETDWASLDIYSPELNGEILNDSVYNRNLDIESKYNVKITQTTLSADAMLSAVQKSVAANDNSYDAVMPNPRPAAQMVASDLLMDLNSSKYINLDAPWWDSVLNAQTSVANKSYFIFGDLNIMANEATWPMMFNKKLVSDYSLDDPYQLVREGKWTLDKMTEMSLGFNYDLDGNGIMDQNDMWGAVIINDSIWGWLNGAGGVYSSKDENDLPVFTPLDEKMNGIYEKLSKICKIGTSFNAQDSKSYSGGVKAETANAQKMFESNRALFFTETLQGVRRLRSMETEFGVIPSPKYDENQENYITNVNSYATTCLAIPVTCDIFDQLSAIVEDMSYKSMETITPTYFETVISGKYMRDEESLEMLDIIKENRICELGMVYNFANVMYMTADSIKAGGENISSVYAKITPAAENEIKKLIENF